MATTQLPPDFKEFLQLLHSNRVEYLLIGGYAVGYYGYPRATADIDIWVSTAPENAEKLVRVLKQFGFDLPQLSTELFTQDNQVIRMGRPPMRIEIITSISGVDFAECYRRKVEDKIDNIDIDIISLEDLKVNKKASGRYKDLDDLKHLP